MGILTQLLLERAKQPVAAAGVAVAEFGTGAGADGHLRLLLGVGCLGGFTTFSSFSLEAVSLIQKAAYGEATLYVTLTTLLGLLAVLLGMAVVRAASGRDVECAAVELQ